MAWAHGYNANSGLKSLIMITIILLSSDDVQRRQKQELLQFYLALSPCVPTIHLRQYTCWLSGDHLTIQKVRKIA